MVDRREYLKEYRKRRKAKGWKRVLTPEQFARQKEKATAWNSANKDRRKQQVCNQSWYLRQVRYGLTPDEYQAEYERLLGLCALGCGRSIEVVDHDHATDRYRGLLCRKCNLGLGYFEDDSELMKRAARYVEEARNGVSNS